MINNPDLQDDSVSAGPVFGHIDPIPLTERVTAALKNAFFSGQLKPGDSIVERQVAAETKLAGMDPPQVFKPFSDKPSQLSVSALSGYLRAAKMRGVDVSSLALAL